jgi:hypothetical protein
MVEKPLKLHCFKNMKYHIIKCGLPQPFSQFLKVQDASTGVQGRNILLFVDNCADHLQDM